MGNEMSVSDLGEQLETSYTFMIDNFSHRKASIRSPTFLSGQCEWYVEVNPKNSKYGNSLWLYLAVENPYSSSIYYGWSRRANFRFIILNQSGKVVYKTNDTSTLFSGHMPAQGVCILKGIGCLENDKLIVKVEVKVVEVGYLTGREMSEVETFEVPLTQVQTVSKIFEKHPDIAVDFKPKSQALKTAYMIVLLGLIQKLRKPPQGLSKTELEDAQNELSELTEAGFKLDWLKTKLEEVSLKRKNAFAGGCQVEEVEERIKNLELTLSDLKVELKCEKAKSAVDNARLLSLDDIL